MADIFDRILRTRASNSPNPDSGNLFESRITHTPGRVGATSDPDAAGQYAETEDPLKSIDARTDLTVEEKAQLKKAWAAKGKGFITVPPSSVSRSDTLRHEQIHALQKAAEQRLRPHINELSGLVSPDARAKVESPFYADERKRLGENEALAEEGVALDLTNLWPLATDKDKRRKLYQTMLGYLDPEERKQLQSLVK